MNAPIVDHDGHCIIHVHVVTRASKTRAVGIHGDRVKIQVAAPPVDGEANAALVHYLAKTLGVPKDAVTLTSGGTGRRKSFRVDGVDLDTASAALGLG